MKELFSGERLVLLQLVGLFRTTIQYRYRLRLLISGAAPFDELDKMWDDHFFSVRNPRVENLNWDTSLELLTHSLPDFQSIPLAVAERLYQHTSGKPLFLQLYGSLLLNLLNDEQPQ